jgi:ribonuclease HI
VPSGRDGTSSAARRDLDSVVVHTDGASRGNPGPAAIGVVIAEPSGRVLVEFGESLAPTTNNVAEYTAVVRALERAAVLGARRVQVMMDSQLVVRQLNGSYRVKHRDMLPLYRKVLELIQRFEQVSFEHVPREENVEADRLANQALDGGAESNESVVGSVFKALTEDRPSSARGLLAETFRYERATGKPMNAVAFLDGWPGRATEWTVTSIRPADGETILEARQLDSAILWRCLISDGKIERIVEYRDRGD